MVLPPTRLQKGCVVSVFITCVVHRGVKGGGAQFTWRHITAGCAENSQPGRKYFLQYNTIACERPLVRTWWCQTCFLTGRHNLITPLVVQTVCPCTVDFVFDCKMKFKLTLPNNAHNKFVFYFDLKHHTNLNLQVQWLQNFSRACQAF